MCNGALDPQDVCLVCGHNNNIKLIGAGGTAGAAARGREAVPEPGDKDIESIVRWLSASGSDASSILGMEEARIEKLEEARASGAVAKAPDGIPEDGSGAAIIADLKVKLMEANTTIEKLRLELKTVETVTSISSPADASAELSKAVRDRLKLELVVKDRDRMIGELKSELNLRQEKLNELSEKTKFKDDEFNSREIDLQHREALLREELMKVEMNKAQYGSIKEVELKKSLEDLREQIKTKEEKIKSLEKYLSQKEEELDRREKALIGKEVEMVVELTKAELNQERVRTGTPRLDDLLLGGMLAGTQAVIYGPPFVGKEVVMNSFAAEGLRKGIPVVWVSTDRTVKDIREEMAFVLNGYEEYEKLGLIYYIDAYSRSVGDTSKFENTAYVEDFSDIDEIDTLVEKRLNSVRDIIEKKSCRIVFRSISSLTALYDTKSIFKMMRPFVAKRKRDKCTAMYCVEKGIVSDQDVQIIGSIMDGVFEFETDGQNNFLSIKGIGETQTREKVKYTASKSGLSIGSFSLGHIK